MTCTSSGTINCEADTRLQAPTSIASRLTIQRRNKLRRLQALPHEGRGKKYATPGRPGTSP
jgi:hypothetical protein